jgi:hypothetical protein
MSRATVFTSYALQGRLGRTGRPYTRSFNPLTPAFSAQWSQQ